MRTAPKALCRPTIALSEFPESAQSEMLCPRRNGKRQESSCALCSLLRSRKACRADVCRAWWIPHTAGPLACYGFQFASVITSWSECLLPAGSGSAAMSALRLLLEGMQTRCVSCSRSPTNALANQATCIGEQCRPSLLHRVLWLTGTGCQQDGDPHIGHS